MKKISKNTLTTSLVRYLGKFIEENEIETRGQINETTRLIGGNAIFDSIDLVTFIVELEDFLQATYNIDIILTSDSAMSRRASPFTNIKSLVEFILNEI